MTSLLPTISILMPVYNDAATLPACLDSIRTQTFQDFELIVVNDGSTDHSPKILQHYAQADARIVLLNITHQGIVPALNQGLALCRGRYIARMDADDHMLPERLAEQYGFVEAHPQLDLIGSLVQGFSPTGKLSRGALQYQNWSNSLLTHEEIRQEIFAECPIMHPTFFGRQSLFQALQGYQDNGWAEDYDFLLRAFLRGCRFGKVPQVLVHKRQSPDRLSKKDPRYKRPALMKAKMHYLLAGGMLAHKTGILIAGTGPTGRLIAQTAQTYQVPIHGFFDNHPGPPDRTVMRYPAWGFEGLIPSAFLENFRTALITLGLGAGAERQQLIHWLRQNDFVESQDFVRLM